ncbi:MAG: DUF559 domain-containing protein [Acidimicrobiia bacterium]
MAACVVGPSVASHRSAAVLWNFPGFGEDVVEITSLRHRRRKQTDVVWHESVRLDDRECTLVDRIPVTLPTRTILDLGAVLSGRELLHALDDALRRKLTSILRLRSELESWGDQRRGSGNVRRAIALRVDQPVPESVLETEFDYLIRRSGLPAPTRQWIVRGARGAPIARVDFAYPAAGLLIEIDGVRYHDGAVEQERDLNRDNAVVGLGLRVLRFKAHHIRRQPERVITQVAEALNHPPASLDPPHDGERRNQR